ncbi:hypothetical protein [Burkholderia perseverans]|uniref:hypothetical protein n=1 Tax=Burkholderia perseverans TaxID=2615214 RepID=UPI001FED59EA|nr:hypothetical protein [Burkholderia perseverans]
MITLGSSSSLFQFALGANAVMPALLSDFRRWKELASEMTLRRLKEVRPDFDIKEHQKPDFVDFVFKSSGGQRIAHKLNLFVALYALVACAVSLGALCWSADRPELPVKSNVLALFVFGTIVLGPAIYVSRDLFLSHVYRTLTVRGLRSDPEALLLARCAELYIQHSDEWRVFDVQFDEQEIELERLIWSMRAMRAKMAWHSFIQSVRSMFIRHKK